MHLGSGLGGSQLKRGWGSPHPFPEGPLLARGCGWRAVAGGGGDFLPLREPLFLLDPDSCFLRTPLAPGSWGELQSHASRRVRHCLGKLCFGITGKSCWDRFGSVSLPGRGQGWGGPPGPLQTPRTRKCLGTGEGEAMSAWRWDSQEVSRGAEMGKHGRMWKKLDLRVDL